MQEIYQPRRLIRAGDIVRIKGQHGSWKVTSTQPAQGGGTRITADSLHAYPRVEIRIAASRATLATQE